MTSPAPTPTLAQQRAIAHAELANDLATPDDNFDKFLEPGQLAVVRAYRALAHALLATFVMNVPDDLLSSGAAIGSGTLNATA